MPITTAVSKTFRSRWLARVIAASLLVIAASPQPAAAWGNTGHEAVASAAWQLMGKTARAQALTLIKTVPQLTSPTGKKVDGYKQWLAELPAGLTPDRRDMFLFMRAATWADAIKHVGFHDSDNPPAGSTVEKAIGFGDTASHGYWHFVDAGFTSDSSAVPATPIPGAAEQIAELRTGLASADKPLLKAYELIWLEHMVGDIHQPLHGVRRFVAGASDLGGNDVKITISKDLKTKFEASLPTGASPNDPKELHAFWDDLPGEANAILGLAPAAEFARTLTAASAEDIAITDPAVWAANSFAIAKAHGYADPVGPGNTSADGTPYAMTDAYYAAALADAQSQIALAGGRLAKLLNDTWPEARHKP